MGDIDGDGRADYLVMDDGGNILAWRNGWIGKLHMSSSRHSSYANPTFYRKDDSPRFWEELGMRFPAKGMGDGRGVRFHDLNGDVSIKSMLLSSVSIDVGIDFTGRRAETTGFGLATLAKRQPGPTLEAAQRAGLETGSTLGGARDF